MRSLDVLGNYLSNGHNHVRLVTLKGVPALLKIRPLTLREAIDHKKNSGTVLERGRESWILGPNNAVFFISSLVIGTLGESPTKRITTASEVRMQMLNSPFEYENFVIQPHGVQGVSFELGRLNLLIPNDQIHIVATSVSVSLRLTLATTCEYRRTLPKCTSYFCRRIEFASGIHWVDDRPVCRECRWDVQEEEIRHCRKCGRLMKKGTKECPYCGGRSYRLRHPKQKG